MLNVSMAAVVLQQEGIYSHHDLIQVVSSQLVTIAFWCRQSSSWCLWLADETKKEITALLRDYMDALCR